MPSKMFQLYESDLETLEQELPVLMDFASENPKWNQSKDIQEAWDMVRGIISKVRWNYGPPSRVEPLTGEGSEG
jgi:hypothetical protein